MPSVAEHIERAVLLVHRLNGGTLTRLNPAFRVLDPELRLQSPDVTELLLAIEHAFGVSLREENILSGTWGSLIRKVEQACNGRTQPASASGRAQPRRQLSRQAGSRTH